MVSEPEPFVLTMSEAEEVQLLQLKRQAEIGRKGPWLRGLAIGVPVSVVALLYLIDHLGFGGRMPGHILFFVIVAYLFGLLTHIVILQVSLAETRKKLLSLSKMVWWPRTVRLADDGLTQDTDVTKAHFAWSVLDELERVKAMTVIWSGPLLAVVVPDRAFASQSAAEAFANQVSQRIAGAARL